MFDFLKKREAVNNLQGERRFLVAAKAIVRKGEKFLILQRSETDSYEAGGADFPGGKIEFGEKIEEGLLREVMEESNLEVDIVRPVRTWSFMKNENTQLVGITFLVDYKSGEVKLSWEHSAFKWLSFDEILNGDFPEWIKKDFRLI
ncbi:MAG: NUDIX hydrolase [Candidatus Moranbacteria bacterium GW2011_GWE1_49_15]|nr:MAG: NUDIX hydrolase [Candidatus Moranbacteria bacterium GW2011_GWE2_47_10]KKW07099.1 MAG: NUDIX hydrolase [Candidatus Moranbacteria bacterium GW2011_GWE1_49_15]HBP01116.1 DNA mismatch repair protein MutT [Candidatus Moranbacteria bacterium]